MDPKDLCVDWSQTNTVITKILKHYNKQPTQENISVILEVMNECSYDTEMLFPKWIETRPAEVQHRTYCAMFNNLVKYDSFKLYTKEEIDKIKPGFNDYLKQYECRHCNKCKKSRLMLKKKYFT